MENFENSKYEGYIWESDKTAPRVLHDETIPAEILAEIADNANPFIIEGQLYDGRDSFSIKYVDGRQIITKTTIQEENEKHPVFVDKDVIANFEDGGMLTFREYWEKMPDPLCEGMDVLVPFKLVFIGMKK